MVSKFDKLPARKAWIKENSFPIPTEKSPFFEHFLSTYEEYLKTKTKWESYLYEKENPKDNDSDDLSSNIRQDIIDAISAVPEYIEFNNGDMSAYTYDPSVLKPYPNIGRVLFMRKNVNQYFISIDLKQANFNSLRYVSPNIVLNTTSYAELISKFTTSTHKQNSKVLRQIVFGHLNPKRQQQVQKYMMIKFALSIFEKIEDFQPTDWVCHTADEIVLSLSKMPENDKKAYASKIIAEIKSIIESHPSFGKMPIHYEAFKLVSIVRPLTNKILGYAKEFIVEESNKPFILKGVPTDIFAQVYRYYLKQPISVMDRVFVHDSAICIKENLFYSDQKKTKKEILKWDNMKNE